MYLNPEEESVNDTPDADIDNVPMESDDIDPVTGERRKDTSDDEEDEFEEDDEDDEEDEDSSEQ